MLSPKEPTYVINTKLLPAGSTISMYRAPKKISMASRITYLDGKITLTMGNQEWLYLHRNYVLPGFRVRYCWYCIDHLLLAPCDFSHATKIVIREIPQGIKFETPYTSLDWIYNMLYPIFKMKETIQLNHHNIFSRFGTEIGDKWANCTSHQLYAPFSPLPRKKSNIATVPIIGFNSFEVIPNDAVKLIIQFFIELVYDQNPNNWKQIIRLKFVCRSFDANIETVKCKRCNIHIPLTHPVDMCDDCVYHCNLVTRNGICLRCGYALTDFEVKHLIEPGYCNNCTMERDIFGDRYEDM